MAIDPNPSSDEILVLCNETLAVVEAIQDYLVSDAGKNDPNHDQLFMQAMQLLKEVRRWSGNGIQITGQGVGAAIDEINHAVKQVNETIQKKKQLAHNLTVIGAFAELALAISSGKAGAVVTRGKALVAAIEAG